MNPTDNDTAELAKELDYILRAYELPDRIVNALEKDANNG